jgi:hypothetical protein
MKIKKINEMTFDDLRSSIDAIKANTSMNVNLSDDAYPFRCKFKNRTPDPGVCYVIEINFEKQEIECSNGRVRLYTKFDEIEFIPDIFIFSKYNL